MAKAPGCVREFLKGVPSVWDEVKFLDGYPGKFVVLARRGDGHWYVAGINAQSTSQAVTLDLTGLSEKGTGTLITDGEAGGNLSFREQAIALPANKQLQLTIAPRGGFVLVLD